MEGLLPPATLKQGARVGLNGAAAESASGASKSTTAVPVLVASKWLGLNFVNQCHCCISTKLLHI